MPEPCEAQAVPVKRNELRTRNRKLRRFAAGRGAEVGNGLAGLRGEQARG